MRRPFTRDETNRRLDRMCRWRGIGDLYLPLFGLIAYVLGIALTSAGAAELSSLAWAVRIVGLVALGLLLVFATGRRSG